MNILFVYSTVDAEIQGLRFSRSFKGKVKFASTYDSKYVSPDINLNFFSFWSTESKFDLLRDYLKSNKIDCIVTDHNAFIFRFCRKTKFPYYYYYFNEHNLKYYNYTEIVDEASKAIEQFCICSFDPTEVAFKKSITLPYYEQGLNTLIDKEFSFYCLNNNKNLINKVKLLDNISIFSTYQEEINNRKTELLFSKEYKKSLNTSSFLIIEDNVTLMIDCLFNNRYFYVLDRNPNTKTERLIRGNVCELIDSNTTFNKSLVNFTDMSGYKYLHERIGE
jgi:hypothetical protein